MNIALDGAIQSYLRGSLTPLKSCTSKKMVELILKLFIDVAKEVDDCKKFDTSLLGLKSYSRAQESSQKFLQELLKRLKKPFDALEVIHILEKWGVMTKHENIALWKENLEFRKRFGEDVTKAAATLIQTATRHPLDVTGRTNFTNAVSFAIDKSSTRDVDDAISCDLTTNTVYVHIAAPGEYVRNQRYHALMKEASIRLLSIYSGRDRLPMFPDEVGSSLFSLKSETNRLYYTTTFIFQITQDGQINPKSMGIHASVISKPVCLSYKNVSDILKSPSHVYYQVIKSLEILASLRREWRYAQGKAHRYRRNGKDLQDSSAHLIVDEMMISTNMIAAKFASTNGIPVLYRGVSGGNRFAASSSKYSTFRGTKYTCSVHMSGTKQRDMEKGANVQLDVRPVRHAGLGLDEYVQATCPIRKFSDLIFHCQFNAFIRSQPPPFSHKDLLELKEKVMKLEQAASRIERRAKTYRAYQRLLREGSKLHRGVLKFKVSEVRQSDSRASRPQLLKRMTHRREQEAPWVVFLNEVECEIKALVPFWGRSGMGVRVQVNEVNPRTSYIVARVISQ